MAKPIKNTPVLKGKDAQRFLEKHDAASRAVVDKKEKERILANFQKLQSIAQFR
jgi:hypothetical protein